MNYLAHLYLAAPDKHLMQGGFLGDFVKGPLQGTFLAPIERGIRLHRFIDRFTDAHSAQASIKKVLPERFHRYSGIITDMMCDYFLSTHWQHFYPESISTFNQLSMEVLSSDNDTFNEGALTTLQRMQKGQWLLRYGELDHIAIVLNRIGQRIRFTNPLDECATLLPTICDQIKPPCLEILNDTREAVTKWQIENTLDSNL